MRAVLFAVALLAPTALAHVDVHDPAPERDEPLAAGAMTCLGFRDARCEPEFTMLAEPASGIRVLDAIYVHPAPLGRTPGAAGDPQSHVENAPDGWSPAESLGVAPLILPGPGEFRAWYGRWDDANSNGFIEVRRSAPATYAVGNEWATIHKANISSYVEPGNHPGVFAMERPNDASPDVTYVEWEKTTAQFYMNDANGVIVFPTGSLLARFDVATVTEPVLVSDGARPYTARRDSRVDLDTYAAIAPGPVVALYETLAPPPESPSLGSAIPNGGRLGPAPVGFAPEAIGAPVGAAEQGIFAPYPREWAEGEQSSASGHREAFERRRAWFDLLPAWGATLTADASGAISTSATYRALNRGGAFPLARAGPIPGTTADGGQAMLPGTFLIEIRTGLWHDIDGDGFVGSALAGNAYEYGSRPLPDNYAHPRGEFFGVSLEDEQGGRLTSIPVTLTPDENTWGSLGVLVGTSNVLCGTLVSGCVRPPTEWTTRTGPVTVLARADAEVAGLYTGGGVYFPLGTFEGGFTVCAGPVWISYEEAGVVVRESVHDCDRIGRLFIPA